ncbi:MAG: ogt [Solirubrobacterales bacterium]|nr:ogt [Solirubrobacterales bacterium]
MTHTAYTLLPSPLGPVLLTGGDAGLTRVLLDGPDPAPEWVRDDARFTEAARQLGEYFAGARTAFDLPLRAAGTAFEQRVWDELRRIPYGETTSYGALARRLGHPGAARAVGRANGRNQLAIVVPCHRVIGASGALTGYAGGLERKRALLALERTGRTAPAA